MSSKFVARVATLALCAFAAEAAEQAFAQIQLPEIVVTAPSPIVRAPAGAAQTAPVAPPAPPEETMAAPLPYPIVADTFVPVTVLTAGDLARLPGGTLGDVLFTQPGLSGSTFAPGANRPAIRGLDNFRVRIQENGLGVHDVSDLGEDHGVPIDPLAADQIEVIRGPATLRFGSQAIGGVVSVTNNRIPAVLPADPISTQVKGALTSVDRGIEGAAIVDAKAGNVAFHADAFGRRAGDYVIPGGRQANTAFQAQGAAAGSTVFFDGGYVGAALQHFASLYHIPGIESAEANTRIDLAQTKLSSKGEYRPASGALDAVRFWLGASQYRHHELSRDNGIDGVRATFRNEEQEGRFEAQFMPLTTPLGLLTGALGAQVGHQRLGTSGEAGSLLAPSRTLSMASYLFEELRLTERTKLQAAGRIERIDVRGTAAEFPPDYLPGPDPLESPLARAFTPASGSLGLLHELGNGLIASATGQYVERAPKAAELFSKGPHDASGTFEIGDATLSKEVARTFEIGLRRATGAFRFDATLFHTRYAGFIFKRLTGNTCDDEFSTCAPGPGGELKQVVYSQRDAVFKGAELTTQLDVMSLAGGTLGFDTRYDMVRARFIDGTDVPRIPPYRMGGGVYWRDSQWFARVGLLHAFAQRRIGEGETPTSGYDLLRAEISYVNKLKPSGTDPRELAFGITADNLLNDDVRNHVSFRKDEVLLPGRNVRLFASLRF